MKMNVLLRKLRIENRKFVTSNELKAYCKSMKLDYDTVIRYFAARGYLVRIFRGIFYVKSVEEFELKKIGDWYFGLHTALKLNNMTHEHFAVEDVVTDVLFRANPVTIAGHKFKFVKLSPSLMAFGVKKGNDVRYSDPEKTVLDFIYLWRYRGVPEDRIIADVSEYARNVSKGRLRSYAKNYPKTVEEIVGRVAR